MASTLAQLGFDISTGPLKDAIKSLDGLSKKSDQADKSASRFSRGYSSSMAVAKKSTLAMTAAAIGVSAAIVKYTNDGLENIDMLAKLARAQNATADGIRAVQIAAGDAGLDGMSASLTRLTRRLGAAKLGNKEYGDTVSALGLNIDDLGKLDADEKIASIADAVQSSGLSMEETARHLQNLGFEQSNANAFFRAGGDAIRNAKGEVEDYGLSLSAVDTAKVEAANDAWSRTALATEAATNQLAIGMTPVIQTVAQYLNDAAKEGDGFGSAIDKGVELGVKGFAFLVDAGAAVIIVFEVLGKSIAAGMIGAEAAILSMAVSIIEGPIKTVNELIGLMNRFTGTNISEVGLPSFFNDLKRDAISANQAAKLATRDIHETLMKPLPGSGILAHYGEVKKATNDSAVAVVAAEKKANKERADIASTGGDKAGKEYKSGFESQTSRVADSLQDAITSGDWAGIGATIGATLASGIAQVVGDNVGASMGSNLGSAIAAPMIGAIAGGLAGLAAQKLSEFFADDYDPTASRQASQGTGTILGSIDAKSRSIEKASEITSGATSELVGINRSMLRALEQVNIGISGASARVAGGAQFTGATPGFGATTMADDLISANLDFASALTFGLVDFGDLLGGSVKKKDEGIQIVGGYITDLIDDTLVNSYATFRVKKNAWSNSKTKEKTSSLGDGINDQFSLVFESILDSVISGASVFGLDSSAANGFSVDTARLSLEGLDAAQKQAAIEEYFGTVFDGLTAHTIPWLNEFQKAGEGLGETLARVATETQVAQEAVKQLGFQFADLSGQDLAEASSQLIELSGGIEQFVSSMGSFIQNFASEAQQFEITQNSLTSAFEQSNLALPQTRQGYFDLLRAQDGGTAAGAENIATLLRLQSTASDYYKALEAGAESATAAQKENLNQLASSQSSALALARSAADAVDNAINGLSTSGTNGTARRESALSSLGGITSASQIGSGAEFSSMLATATNINAADFASFNQYVREASKTGAVLSGLKQITDSKVTKEQQLLDGIQKEIAKMSAELVNIGEASVKQEAKTARILEKIQIDGLPVQA